MTTAAQVIAVARSQLGYVESGDNQTKYWAELDPELQGSPWCAGFVSWVFKHAGMTLPNMGKSYGFVYCPNAVAYAYAHGLFSASGHYAPGDIVLYGPGGSEHTEIIVSDDGTTMVTIGGNTGNGRSANNGGVYQNNRAHDDWVYGVLQTSKLLRLAPTPPTPPIPPVSKVKKMSIIQSVTGAIYVTDGFSKRHIQSMLEVQELLKVAGQTAVVHCSRVTIDNLTTVGPA